MPELTFPDYIDPKHYLNCYGVCSDHVDKIRKNYENARIQTTDS